LTTEQRELIKVKLKNNQRTLFFLYAAGLYDETYSPSMDLMNSFLETDETSHLEMTTSEDIYSESTSAYGDTGGSYKLSPIFFGSLDTSYGRYKSPFSNLKTYGSMYKIVKSDYKIIYSNQGITNIAFLKALFKDAGVFFYSDDNLIIDGSKNYLLVHGKRTEGLKIHLPKVVRSISAINLQEKAQEQLFCRDCSSVHLPFNGPETFLLKIED
jgi:hypothetical protein